MRIPIIAITLLTAITQYAGAVQLPRPSVDDPRIGYIDYKQDDVTHINVQRGVATRILLGHDEKIVSGGAGTGFPADCAKSELEWCMHAETGSNQILVKPRDGATHNNLELRTDRRDYSFEFDTVEDRAASRRGQQATAARSRTAMYRVVFQYPEHSEAEPRLVTDAFLQLTQPRHTSPEPAPPPPPSGPVPRNWNYSMRVAAGAEDIVPTLVFDDGRFTYFRFPANREVPTIYVVSSGGEEARVNFHMEVADPDIMVVERMGRRFMLRLGGAVVGIWNDAFDSYGIAPAGGTSVDGLARSIR